MIDPLTCTVWYRGHDEGCDCGAPPEALHSERCSVTPIYAALIAELGSVQAITDEIWGYTTRYMRTYPS